MRIPRVLAVGALALLLAAAAPVNVTVQVDRSSFDLLDTVAIRIAADNPGRQPATVRFSAPTEYAVEILRGSTIIWNSVVPPPSPQPSLPGHTRALNPGATTIALYDWDGLLRDGTTPQPGTYTVRVRLLADPGLPAASTSVRFIAPLPISAIAKLPLGSAVTVGGRLDATLGTLSDATGSVLLSRRLLKAPDAPIVIRGFVSSRPDGTRMLSLTRWAALAKGE